MGNKEGFPTPQLRLTVPTSSLLPECSAPSAYMKGINATHSSTRTCILLYLHSQAPAEVKVKVRLRASLCPASHLSKNGVRTSTDPYGKDSHLGFFVNVQVGPQTAPAIPHGLPTSLSSLHHTHLLFSTVCAITHSTQTALRPRHPYHRRVLHHHHHHHHHPRDRVRLDYRPGQRRAGRRANAAQSSRSARKIRHPKSSTAPPCATLYLYHRPVRPAFTNKELRELTSLDDASMHLLAPELLPRLPDMKLTRQQSLFIRLLRLQRGTSNLRMKS